jgi:fatty acid desaturase
MCRWIVRSVMPTRAVRYQRINLALLAALGGSTLGGLFGVPFLLPIDLRFGWLLLPVALLTNPGWALHHEAIHGSFHADRRINLAAGRMMAILLGSSFDVLRFAHLMHHRFNRNPTDRPDLYDPAAGSRARARLRYLGHLTVGVYLAEVIAPLLCCLPASRLPRRIDRVFRGSDPAVATIRAAAQRLVGEPRRLRRIRTDALLSAALIAASAMLFGRHWAMLLAFLAARGVLISVFDNVYHFGTPIDRPDYAYNLAASAPLRLLFLNMNLHRVHHRRPSVPWWDLPVRFRAGGERCDARLLSVALKQFAGPLPLKE